MTNTYTATTTIQHFTGTPVSVGAGGTWRVRCTCGWSADAAFRSEAFDLGYIHEDGGWTVAGTPTTYEEGVALVYAGVRTRILKLTRPTHQR